MSETAFFAENTIVNDNIKLAIKKINKATTVKRNDLIVELVNHPIRWCGIISEASEDSILLNNESIDGYFIFSKLPFFVINNKIKIIFILKNRNIAANLNKGDRIYAKNKAIYSTKNDEIISLYILLDEISIYKYNKSLFRFNDKKERFEPANNIFEFNNIIFESNNFRIYDRLSYYIKIFIDDKMAILINSDNKEILLYENGRHVIRAEMELDYGHKIITSNVLNIELNESLRLGINFISEDGKDKIVINKKN